MIQLLKVLEPLGEGKGEGSEGREGGDRHQKSDSWKRGNLVWILNNARKVVGEMGEGSG